jgi:hypothetical protein
LKCGPHGCILAADMAVVMFVFFGHVGGEKQIAGDPSADGASAMTSPRSRVEGWA